MFVKQEYCLEEHGAHARLFPSRPFSSWRDNSTCMQFWPHKDMEDLSGWSISSMPGPPPRQHEHGRLYTLFTHLFILTRRIWKDDYDGQMIFGDSVDLKLLDICLTGEEKPQKTSPRKLVLSRDRTRARCMTGAHAIASSTAVDNNIFIL